jgi:deoxyribodipyrimidine photolyase-related protein
MSNILLLLFPSQLFETTYIEKIFLYTEDNIKIKSTHICLYEHPYFFTKFPYHKIKLIFHRASMKKYFDSINSSIYKKTYLDYDEPIDKLNKYIKTNQIDQIRFFNPIEKELIKIIMEDKIINQTEKLVFPSPYFLNSTNFSTNINISNELSSIRHDLFYKLQRIKYNIMVQKSKADSKTNSKTNSKTESKYIPEGLKWSYDTENRKPFEKSQQEPPTLKFASKNRTKYLEEAKKYIDNNFSHHYGISDLANFIYPIDREESIKWLEYFISNKLDNFGKYEDAMSSRIKFGFHSVLSPITNIGLITPRDIIKHTKTYKKNLASKEGFIRQIIGWREYCYFTYDLYGNYLKSHSLYNTNKFDIPKYVWESKTQIPPIDNILKNLSLNAYSHHIERLMGIGNFLVLIETNPQEIFNWFQTMYIDAYDVFMIPNVYGMLTFGKLNESTHMMTKPYFASSNYIMKMSDYKSTECVKIGTLLYKWDAIMDALYWYHIYKYSNEFKKIYSTSSGASRWDKFNSDKKKEIINLAKIYISWIHKR